MKVRSQSFFFTLAAVLLFPSFVFPAEVAINISPIRVEHLAQRGEKVTDVITLTNDGTSPTRLKVSIEDWRLSQEGNPIFMKAEKRPYSCADWIRVNPVDFRLGAGQTKVVRYTLAVPSQAGEGGYRAAIVFETVPEMFPGEKTKRVFIRGRIVTILYETVGKPIPQGHANYLKAEPKKGGIDFLLGVHNTGKVHFRTKGAIVITDSAGKKVLEAAVPDVPVLPETERDLKISLSQTVPKGQYKALAMVDIGRKELIGAETPLSIE